MIEFIIGLVGVVMFMWALGARLADRRLRLVVGIVGGLICLAGLARHPESLFPPDCSDSSPGIC